MLFVLSVARIPPVTLLATADCCFLTRCRPTGSLTPPCFSLNSKTSLQALQPPSSFSTTRLSIPQSSPVSSLRPMASLGATPLPDAGALVDAQSIPGQSDCVTKSVGVVGAGIAGVVSALKLASLGCHVSVFDLGRGPGGRMSQRRERVQIPAKEEGALGASSGGDNSEPALTELRFDHGAQYFSAGSKEASEFLQEYISKGLVADWTGRFGTLQAESGTFEEAAPESPPKRRLVGVPGMNSLCQLALKQPNIKTVFSTQVASIEWLQDQRQWEMHSASGDPLGRFSAVVIAAAYRTFRVQVSVPPSLVTNDLTELISGISDVPAEPCFALMLAFPSKPMQGIPLDAAKVIGSETISWIARDSSKPGRTGAASRGEGGGAAGGEGEENDTWVVHSTAGYARGIMAAAPAGKLSQELQDKVGREMLGAFKGLLRDVEIPDPVFSRVHRWGGAFPSEARAPEGQKCLTGGVLPLAACGDFCISPRVESAIESALEASNFVYLKFGNETPRM